jgi:hypothetical protein
MQTISKRVRGLLIVVTLISLLSQFVNPQLNVDASTHNTLPTSIDLSSRMPPVRDQMSQGSCAAWAVAYYYKSFQEHREHGWSYTNDTLFSPSYIFNQYATANDQGISIDDAMQTVVSQGVASLTSSPYNHQDWQTQPSLSAQAEAAAFKAQSYEKIEPVDSSNIDSLKSHLAGGDPFVLNIPLFFHIQLRNWNESLLQIDTVIDIPSTSDLFLVEGYRHAITIVGYDDTLQRFKFVNSWGPGWGENGYGYITYGYVIEMGTAAYYMVDKIDPPPLTISAVTGQFFKNPTNGGTFTATPATVEEFRQSFPVINFNPPTGTIPCSNNTGVGIRTRPFTAVVPQLDGSCLTIIAQGNGKQAGVGTLGNFQAVFRGSFGASGGGQVTFDFFSDDGWILSIGPNADGAQPTYVSGPMVNAPVAGPFTGYPIVGSYNVGSPVTENNLVVDFPAGGTYPFELNYTEGYLGELALTLTVNSQTFRPGVDVHIGSQLMESYFFASHESKSQSYAGVDNGPAKVSSTDGTKIIASERVAYSPDGGTTWTSHSELMGLPINQLATSYTFPWYNNVDLNSQLRFGNVGTANTVVTVTVAGIVRGRFSLAPNASIRRNFSGLNAGPVHVTSSGGVPIIASMRVAYFNGSEWTSFSEMMGMPSNKLTNSYVFPWYNNNDLNSQLRFGNVGIANTIVTVTVGGVVRGAYPLAPNQSQRVSYAGLDSGPIKVTSSGNVPIIASLRVAYTPNGGVAWTDFSEMMGLPSNALNSHYSFPIYNNANFNTQLRFGNVGNTNTTVTVTINEELKGIYSLAPNQSRRVDYPNLNSGPVVIESSGGVPIIASERVAYFNGSAWTSFAEMMGLPQSQLTSTYLFPWYNNVELDTQLRFGVP